MEDIKTPSPLRPGSVTGPRENKRRGPSKEDLQRKETEKVSAPTATTVPVQKDNSNVDPIPEKSDSDKTIQQMIDKLRTEAGNKLTPKQLAEVYDIGLDSVRVDKSKARRILDNVFDHEYHEEEYKIGGRKVVVLRTRNYTDVQRALRFAEAEAPRLPLHIDDLLCRYNLAASLSKYGDKSFSFPDEDSDNGAVEEAFDKRLAFVMRLPTPVAGRLNTCLMEFDAMMNAVLADGAPEDF